MRNNVVIASSALVVFGLGLSIGVLWHWLEHRCVKSPLLDREIACEHHFVITKIPYTDLEKRLSAMIEEKKTAGSVLSASVYFRDLEVGPVFGVHRDAPYTPASLMKLPVVIALLDMADEDPKLLDRTIRYSPDVVHEPQQVVPIETSGVALQYGETYTIEELMRASIVHSDNLAYYLLVWFINTHIPDGGPKALTVFRELGVVDPEDPTKEILTARGYGAIFRQLYFASYLSVESSGKLLTWLSESTFEHGIRPGVPKEVPVAHKFGEREFENGIKQLHDCGIVYYPDNPYSLCIMTEGKEWEPLRSLIGEISHMVYEEVDARRIDE